MIALISDIHGNYEALRSVLNTIDSYGIKDIYCLGDVCGYYSQINECCEELQKRNIKCLLGNHDWHMIANSPCIRSKSATKCLAYQRKIITDINRQWLTTFPITYTVKNLSIVHGGWQNPIDEYIKIPEREYFESMPYTFFASGHTHKQLIEIFESKTYCNPGSVGQPRDGNPMAAFAIFDENNFNLFRVEYDIDKTCKFMKQAGFDEYYYKRLYSGSENFI